MSDPRTIPWNGKVAHVSLKGEVEAERFVEGKTVQLVRSVTRLYRTPGETIERELLFGECFRVLDYRTVDDVAYVFGYAERDGYCGYLQGGGLVEPQVTTHRVAARESYANSAPSLKTPDIATRLFLGAQVSADGVDGDWTRIACRVSAVEPEKIARTFVPTAHLRPIDEPEINPVDVARRFLGTPYLWGGNSGRGIDCSGLVQAAMLACGWACPGDSDLQQAMPGKQLSETDPLQPGDLIFWEGHVALATGPDTMIHANAHHMATVEEAIAPAVNRIAATDTGPVTSRLRPERYPWTSPF